MHHLYFEYFIGHAQDSEEDQGNNARLTNNMDNLSDILTRLGNHLNLNFVTDQLNQFRVQSD